MKTKKTKQSPEPKLVKKVLVTPKMMRDRAAELATEPEIISEAIVLKPGQVSPQWDPILGSLGHTPKVPMGDDEDNEGKSTSERLVEKGIWKAEKDQMRRAGRF